MNARRSVAGFTLTELAVAMLVAAVFGLAALRFYRAELQSLQDQSSTLDATDKTRATVAFLTRELRLTGYDPKATALVVPGYKGIRDAGPNYLWIVFDRNGNGTIDWNAADPAAESVLYSYDATNQQILRTVAGVAQPLAKNVPPGTFSFQYFDPLGNQLAFDTAPSVTIPTGAPALPTIVAQALTGATQAGTSLANQMLNAANRDLVALVRLNVMVQAVGSPWATPPSVKLSERVTVPARLLDRL